MLSRNTGLKLSLCHKKRLFLGADLSLWKELFFSDLLSDGGRMGESREDEEGIVTKACSGMYG